MKHCFPCSMRFYLGILWLSCAASLLDAQTEIVARIESSLPASDDEANSLELFSLQQGMQHYSVPGCSVPVLDDGKIAWKKGYGVVELGTKHRVNPETLFQAASISKPVTALATLRLVEQGKLDLDRDVNQYLKSWQLPDNEFTAKSAVTLRGILTHSAGLTVHGFMGYSPSKLRPTLVQILDGEQPANSKPVRVVRAPGEAFSYSAGGTTLQQLLLEDVTQTSFAVLMQKLVLEPLGMTSSTYEQPLPESMQGNAAVAHSSSKPYLHKWRVYPEQAAAGLWTTPNDLARFALAVRAAYNGQADTLISQATASKMLTASQAATEGPVFGLGPVLTGTGDDLAFGHSGSNFGYRCFMGLFTESGDGAVIMTNGSMGCQAGRNRHCVIIENALVTVRLIVH